MNKPGIVAHSWLKHRCGRHPMFAAALVTVACVVTADAHLEWGLGLATAFGLAGAKFVNWRCAMAWFLCGVLASGLFAWRGHTLEQARKSLLASGGGLIEARLLEDGHGSGETWAATAMLTSGVERGTKVWWKGRGTPPVSGSVASARGSFQPLPVPRNPGEFDRGKWLDLQGVACVFDASRTAGEAQTGQYALLGAKIRHGFRARVADGLLEDSQQAHVIRAVVIGERPPDEAKLIDAFRLSGTLHVFSVSGLHVVMVASIGWLVMSMAGVPRRASLPALITLVFGYAWITGFGAPSARAAWMATVFLGAFAFRRRPDLLNALGTVLLGAMLWDGRLLFQPGVQLSYGVVAAIAVGTSWAAKNFKWLTQQELYLPIQEMNRWQKGFLKLRRNIASSLAVSTAASIGSTPLTVFHFGLVSPISLLANLILVPLVFVLLSVALFSTAISPFAPPISRTVNQANGWVAKACVLAARSGAAIPGGHFFIGTEKRPQLLVYDLDYGDAATCFSAGRDGAVMFDCGGPWSFRYKVAPSLDKLGITPDSVVFSHPDGGHLGGGSAVWELLPIRQVMLPVARSRSPGFRAWARQAPANDIRISLPQQGARLPMPDGAILEILHAPDLPAVNAPADDRVLVTRLHWRGWKILFTGDAGMGTEFQMLDKQTDVSADVIISGRHRRDVTISDRFLDAVKPLAIIASNATYPESEALPPEATRYWKSLGIHVFDQRETGAVTLRPDTEGNLHIHGFLCAEPTILIRP